MAELNLIPRYFKAYLRDICHDGLFPVQTRQALFFILENNRKSQTSASIKIYNVIYNRRLVIAICYNIGYLSMIF